MDGEQVNDDPGARGVADLNPLPAPEVAPPRPGVGAPRPGAGGGPAAGGTQQSQNQIGRDTLTVDQWSYLDMQQRLARYEQAERDREEDRVRKERERQSQQPQEIQKALQAQERRFQQTLTERDGKIKAYEQTLRNQTLTGAIREALDRWDAQHPQMPIRPGLRPFLADALQTKMAAEWDEQDGRFVAVEPTTNRLAADVIVEMLGTPNFAEFLAPSTQGGAAARVGGVRPGAGLGFPPGSVGQGTAARLAQVQQQAAGGPQAFGMPMQPGVAVAQQQAGQPAGVPGVTAPSTGNPFADFFQQRQAAYFGQDGTPSHGLKLTGAKFFSAAS